MLGFTEVTWDNCSGEEPQPAAVRKTWDELTDDERTAVEYLGFIKLSWDTRAPSSSTKTWAALTDDERTAATDFGYTETNWDNLSGEELQPPAANKYWSEMGVEEIVSLSVLGYTQTNWDNWPCEPPCEPAAFTKQWRQLTSCGEYSSHSPHDNTIAKISSIIGKRFQKELCTLP